MGNTAARKSCNLPWVGGTAGQAHLQITLPAHTSNRLSCGFGQEQGREAQDTSAGKAVCVAAGKNLAVIT